MVRYIASMMLVLLLAGCGREARRPVAPLLETPGKAIAVGARLSSDADDEDDLEMHLGPVPIRVPEPYRLRAGDEIKISVLGDEGETTERVLVGPDGRIHYLIARDVLAEGKTLSELAGELEGYLAEIYKAPRVAVSGIKYSGNSVTVLGLIRNPGRYPISRNTRLLDAIALAGGIPLLTARGLEGETLELADLERAYLIRGRDFVDVDFEALFSREPRRVARNNVLVQADDRIYIPSAVGLENKIIVLGAVKKPGLYRYKKRLTFIEAVAMAGGPTIRSWERNAFIVRGSLKAPTVISVNARSIMTGQAHNIDLHSGDIVFFPKSPLGKTAEVGELLRGQLEGLYWIDTIWQRNK